MNREPQAGDIGIPTRTEMGYSDFGASGMVFQTSYYTKGVQYKVISVYECNGTCIVIDSDDGRMGMNGRDFDFFTEEELNINK